MSKYRTGKRADGSSYHYPIKGQTFQIHKDLEVKKVKGNKINLDDAKRVGEALGIDWNKSEFCPKEFKQGMDVELEHKNITGGDILLTGKIALAHLEESPKYYEHLEEMEESMKGSNSSENNFYGKDTKWKDLEEES